MPVKSVIGYPCIELGFWKLRSTGNTRKRPMWHAYLIRSLNLFWEIPSFVFPLPAMKPGFHKMIAMI
jgi:hypothetical protein